MYAQAYADDVAGLIIGKDPPTLVGIANRFMRRAEEWGKQHDLVFSKTKTEIVVFTRLKKWNPARPFQMGGTRLAVSKTAKYLGVTLDSRLSFNPHIEGKVKAATQLLHRAGRLVGKTWGLTPSRARWVYTAMVRPFISYGAICWAKATATAKCETSLRKLQRIALIQITATYPSSPTAALEMLTGIRPLHLHVREMAIMASVRLGREHHWQQRKTFPHRGWLNTHSDFCNRIREGIPELQMPEEETGLSWLESPSFSTHIGDRLEATGRTFGERDVICYTDGSKLDDGKAGAGAVIMEDGHEAALHEHLGKTTTVYQAEVRAIELATGHLLESGTSGRTIVFRVDNRAAIQSLGCPRTSKRSVKECFKALQKLSQNNMVTIEWVPGHAGVPGNEWADAEAKKGAKEAPFGPEPFAPVADAFIKERVATFFEGEHQNAWWGENRFRMTKESVGWAGKTLPKRLLGLNRESLRHLVQLITGHCILEQHRFRSNPLVEDPICPKCGEEVDTPQHLVGVCNRYRRLRESIFGSEQISLMEELHHLNIRKIARFCKLSRRFVFGDDSSTD